MKTQSYKDLIVWQQSLVLANCVYEITRSFPNTERFGLADQMRRAAVSIPSNIAEGCERRSPAELRRFLLIALGSLSELETQVIISQQQGFTPPEASTRLNELLPGVGRLIHCFLRKI